MKPRHGFKNIIGSWTIPELSLTITMTIPRLTSYFGFKVTDSLYMYKLLFLQYLHVQTSFLIYITACCRRQCKVAEDHEKDDPTPKLSQNKAIPLLAYPQKPSGLTYFNDSLPYANGSDKPNKP